MRVLIIGHACSPRMGSEPSFTWNWAWHLSRHHQVWALAHPHDRSEVERFLHDHPNPRLRFHWQCVPRHLDPWDPRVPDRWPRLHYWLWLRFAYNHASELQERFDFDIVHHVSHGSVSAPPPVSRLRVPFVWGPIGGAQRPPASFRTYFGPSWTSEIARNFRLDLLRISKTAHNTARASEIALATNHETAELLSTLGARDVRLFLDSGIPSNFSSCGPDFKPNDGCLRLLWVGRMQHRKALPLALEAMEKTRDLGVKLYIAGDGPMRRTWEKLAKTLHLETRTEFLGQVPWNEMSRLYQSADAFVFTSLRDSFGTQVLEAMAHGLPILTLNHQGVGTFVPSDAGIKVSVTHPRETVGAIADGIRRLEQNPDARRRMGEAGRSYAKAQIWEKRAEQMSEIYEEVLRRPIEQKARRARSQSPETRVRLGGPAPYGSFAVSLRMRKIDEMLDLKGTRVLDVGCGNGSYTVELARRASYVCGLDIQKENLESFREPIPRVLGAGENLPFPSESFDVVTMIEVLEHTVCDTKVLAECFRVLRPGGQLVLFVPNKLYPFESHPCHLGSFSIGRNIPLVSWLPGFLRRRICSARIYTRRRLFQMAHRAGFRVQKAGYIFPPLDSFPLPLKDIYRRVACRLEKSPLGIFGVSICAILEKALAVAQATRMESISSTIRSSACPVGDSGP